MIDVHYSSVTGYFIEMVTHPDINPIQQGLTSVNRWEPVLNPIGDSHTAGMHVQRFFFYTKVEQWRIHSWSDHLFALSTFKSVNDYYCRNAI